MAQVHPLIWMYVVDNLLEVQPAETAADARGGAESPPGAGAGSGPAGVAPDSPVAAEPALPSIELKDAPMAELGIALGIMLIAHLLAIIASAGQDYLLEWVGRSSTRDIREKVFSHLQSQSLDYHHDNNPGDFVTRVVSDVDAMQQSVLNGLTGLLDELLTFIIVAGVVISLQPVVGTAAIVPLAGSFFIIKIFNKRLKRYYDKVRKTLGVIGEFVHDRLAGVQVIQSFATERVEEERFHRKTQDYWDASLTAAKARAFFFPSIGVFSFITNAVMLGLGAIFIWKGYMTVGVLVAYRGYWWRLQSPVRTLAQTSDILQRARAAAERITQLLNTPIAIEDSPNAQPWRDPVARVEFRDVGFFYERDAPVLRGINLRVEPGEFVAVAGKSGSGKSTMLNLLSRFYEPTSGEILIDGRDYRQYQLRDLRKHTGLVLQDTYLFNGTIRDNIKYARPESTEGEIIAAAKSANAHEFIQLLPRGYDSVVGLRGLKLSGGQRQRISLARTFLTSPPLLLLDEPTSSVEPESERQIHQAIMRLSEERTTILVTHRVSMLTLAGRVVFVHRGEILGDGTHESLLQTCPLYARSYEEWQAEEEAEQRQAAEQAGPSRARQARWG
jgi:ABC-type multidrug transport system fused ATPase/permease subunit